MSRQQMDEAVDADRPDDLFESVDGDYAAHGRSDDRSHARSFLGDLLHRP